MTALLHACGVAAGYRATRILDGIDLELRAGEVHGLIGPNGAGKSTLLRALAALLPLRGGSVLLGEDPRELHTIPPRERARALAFLPQDTTVTADLTVRAVVELGRFAHRSRLERMRGNLTGADARIVAESLERVGVVALADRTITSLSGGQRQLVLIAKQLAQRARFLLLDEPVSALDLGYQLEVLEIIRDLAADGHGIAVVLHDLNLAARTCDRLTVLDGGRLRASGTPAEVLHHALVDDIYGIRSAVDHDQLTNAPRVTALARRRP